MGTDDRDPPDGCDLAPKARDQPEGRGPRGSQAWRTVVRPGLLLLEAWGVLKQHEALAAGARALVMIGDVIMDFGEH